MSTKPNEWKIAEVPSDHSHVDVNIIESVETKTIHDCNPDYDCFCESCVPRVHVIEKSAYDDLVVALKLIGRSRALNGDDTASAQYARKVLEKHGVEI